MRQTIQMTRRRFFASCFMLLILVIAVTGYSMLTTLAEEEPVQGLPYYSSIEIQEGDSLWKIADRYRKGSRMTTQEYVKQLQRMNRLTGDTMPARTLPLFIINNSTSENSLAFFPHLC